MTNKVKTNLRVFKRKAKAPVKARQAHAPRTELKKLFHSKYAALQNMRRCDAGGFQQTLPQNQRYVVTCAQNATPVHEQFLANLERYCTRHNATLVVLPYRYSNATSVFKREHEDDLTWDSAIVKYLFGGRHAPTKHLVIYGDVRLVPTRQNPLAGFDAMSGAASAILGHPKLHLRCIPTTTSLPKILTTTGAVTLPNYSDTTAGVLGEFHYTLGATVVEIDQRGLFHLRQINADKESGAFIDLNEEYTPQGVRPAPRPFALVLGDAHVDVISADVVRVTFGPNGIVPTLKPQHLVWHDLLDGLSINPHHAKNPFASIAKAKANLGDARAELERAAAFVAKHTPASTQSVVVRSNHNDFFRRWMLTHDWKTDPTNALFYLETAAKMVESATVSRRGVETLDPIEVWCSTLMPDVRVLKRDELWSYKGVELSLHGDRGPNGSRGSIRNLRRLGTRSIIGHTHSSGIDEGCYQVGTSSELRLDYNEGPSSWLNTHCILYANGKRSLINIVKGAWRDG